jgi:hypothetical protein
MKRSVIVVTTLLALSAPAARGERPPLEDNAALQYWQAVSMMSEKTKEAIDEADVTAPTPAMLADWVADDNDTRLAYVHAGAAMSRCDWGLDFSKGPELLLPHLNHARTLANFAMLRAAYRFRQQRWRDGFDDVLATLELAKDVGETPFLVSVSVRYGIEDMAITVVASHLPEMDRATLDHLAVVLEPLPGDDSFKRVWPAKSEYVVGWAFAQVGRIERQAAGDEAKWAEGLLKLRTVFGGNNDEALRALGNNVPRPAQLRASLDAVNEMLADLEKVTDLPTADQDERLAGVANRLRRDPVARLMLGDPKDAFAARRRWQTRHVLLKAAVAVAGGGEAAVKEKRYADPFGDGAPFEYRKTENGFDLRSKLTFRGEAVTLSVGKPNPG